ncbi:helix-turn-helix domain-containing protein [Sinomonas terrae]|uniref:Helix-turn-helix transcriptional regulator n=1 Tax=Sinomonas terrae TaxID=2908838 RepID=A0ABS9TWN5_9MICC|nr:helix-turn-helix transcriptional regulator [Sinomonas terrae]MCH6468627.1 helix-turn-helix transcriptional regulator [Sinomonas terrae]
MMEPAARLAAELAGLADRDEYLGAASEMLMKLFPSDHVVYNILDARSPSARVLSFPEYEDGNLSEAFLSVCDDHPIILSYLGDTTPGLWAPRRLSDLVTDLALYRTRTYRVLLRPYGVNRKLALMTADPSSGVGSAWGMNRFDWDYTDRELELAQHIQPMLRLLEAAFPAGGPGGRPRNRAEDFSLTPREQQVLDLLGKGLSGISIGWLLGISPRTVAKHLENAYAKLGCTNRLDALRLLDGRWRATYFCVFSSRFPRGYKGHGAAAVRASSGARAAGRAPRASST